MTATPWTRIVGVVQFKRRLREFAGKVADRGFEDAGVDDDGDPFVRLPDGTVLFGHPTKRALLPAHARLPARARALIPPEAFQVALDTVIRYDEGALAYGGPSKQRNHAVVVGETAVEMGAYLGHYSVRLARDVGSGGRVVAIEANPHNHRILAKNVSANGLRHVTVFACGVWHEPGVLRFGLRPDDHQSTSVVLERAVEEAVEVPVRPLDDILREAGLGDVALMVIQLNGAEPNALRGLTTVRPRHLAIASRYQSGGSSTTPEILEILKQRGYQAEVVAREYVFADLAADSGADVGGV